jgi:hypothetical protein
MIENTGTLRNAIRVQVPPRAPKRENPQSIEIAGFSLCINASRHFHLSANAENILHSHKQFCALRTQNANEKC